MERRDLDGCLLLDKPEGITSNKALQIVKKLFRAKKAGHTGSLDPIATGLLPICFGEATKFSQFLLGSDKHYVVTALLGIQTDTGDKEGSIIQECCPDPFLSLDKIENSLENFRGNILQVPPMYSALKRQGQPLYKLARQGIEVERVARPVTVHHLKALSFQENQLTLDVVVSKGTYIRALVEDLGKALGCGAHVISLRRIGAGPYKASQMVSLETLEKETFADLDGFLLPIDSPVSFLPEVKLSDSVSDCLRKGQIVCVPDAPKVEWVRLVLQNNQFLGLGQVLEDGRIAPRRLTKLAVSF